MGKVISLPARARPASRSLLLLLLGTIRGFSKVVWITLPLAVAVIFNCKDFLVIFFSTFCSATLESLSYFPKSCPQFPQPGPDRGAGSCGVKAHQRAERALRWVALLSSPAVVIIILFEGVEQRSKQLSAQ